MSLILEALRKSEAERRRGQVPELFDAPVTRPAAAVEPARTAAPRLSPAMLAGGAGAVAVLLLGLGWSMRDDAPPGPQVDAEPAVAVDAPDASPAGTALRPALPDSRPLRDPAAAAASTAPTTAASTASTAPAATSAPMRPSPSATAASAPVPGPSSAVRPAAAMPPAPAATTAPLAAHSAGAPVPAAPATPATAPVRVAAPASTGDAPREPAMLRLGDLVAEERRQLPALKMSMHMWAPDRAQRFVILDGARVTEGDRVGDAVVEAITADGAVLAWRGRQLKVPVR